MNMVQFDEAKKLMDEMMKVTIFQPSAKRQMLKDEKKIFLDPNLIMDARHRIIREDLSNTSAKCCKSIQAETKRLQMQEETKELHFQKEQAFIEKELRKFEQDLQKNRPKFCGPCACSKKNIINLDDNDFWKVSSKAKVFINKKRSKTADQKFMQKEIKQTPINASTNRTDRRCSINKIERASFSSIKVTIKDKPSYDTEEQRLYTLRLHFEVLRENARDKRRLREIKINIQKIASQRSLKSCIRVWKMYVKERVEKREQNIVKMENSDTQKIENFINTIAEVQKESIKTRKLDWKESFSSTSLKNTETKKETFSKPFIIESPAQNRLNAQKEIIRKQKMKLVEQSKIIEELKMKQVQEEIMRANEETVNAAKDTLTHCGQHTRRTLIQLMRQAGYRDRSLTTSVQISSPPRFLVRMEARAEARRNRIKLREETRQKKMEEERRKEEAARREEEQERRRLQQEILREAKKMREEREQQRAYEVERCKELNAIAEAFYRKHLLRRYIMEPFITLVEIKNNYINKADNHYKMQLLKKILVIWRTETERQKEIKIELVVLLHNKNLLWRALHKWKEAIKEKERKEQVAKDFSDMRLQNDYFKSWKIRTIEYKIKRLKNESLAFEYYERKLKIKYFNMWKRYLKIVPYIVESERIKNTWREIVQEVVPDFDPTLRGVALED